MNEETLIGYHATKKKNEKNILKDGFKISNSNSFHHWLGNGIYFWKDTYYAVEWNIIDLEKNGILTQKNIFNQYTILEAIIKTEKDKVINLSSPKGTIMFERFKENVINSANTEQKERLREINDDIFWVNFMSQKGLFNKYNIIIANYNKIIKKENNNKATDFIKYEQTQICVKSNDLIENVSIYNDKKEIKELYKIIKDNRRNQKVKEVAV